MSRARRSAPSVRSATPSDGEVEPALRALVQTLPEVSAGLKRLGVPPELEPLFGPSSLGPRHIPVLAYLLEDGPMSVGELARRLRVGQATTSIMATQLQQFGLLVRGQDPRDRRRTMLDLSDERRDVVRDWLEARTNPVRNALARLSPDERAALVRGMTVLAEELGPRPPLGRSADRRRRAGPVGSGRGNATSGKGPGRVDGEHRARGPRSGTSPGS